MRTSTYEATPESHASRSFRSSSANLEKSQVNSVVSGSELRRLTRLVASMCSQSAGPTVCMRRPVHDQAGPENLADSESLSRSRVECGCWRVGWEVVLWRL